MAAYLREIADALSLPITGARGEYKLTRYEEQCVREDLGATLLQGTLGAMLSRIAELRQQEMRITKEIDRKDHETPHNSAPARSAAKRRGKAAGSPD